MDASLLNVLDQQGQSEFERVITVCQGELFAASAGFSIDPHLRLEYARQIKAMSEELRFKASHGAITWSQAAQEANQTRNLIMDLTRSRSTPVGRAIAEKLKKQGKTLNELVAMKTTSIFGPQANFNHLSPTQKDKVYSAVVESAGKSNFQITAMMKKLSHAGKGLVFFSLAIAVYQVYNADDRFAETQRQVAIGTVGMAGAWAGGAIAGLMCGPGAPVCVLIGAFVGGAISAWEMDELWR